MSKKESMVINQTLDRIMSDRFGRYSKYIIQGRALPDARDGLKPVQRRILYAMNDLGLTWQSSYKKSARVVGEVIGKYHPHGDSSIYEAMVRMAQDWKMNVPLVDMHGNKGSVDDDPAAAMRYTEARLSKITDMLLNNIKKDTVSFAPNFDDSEKEPTVLPALLPNLLINGAKGIAAGYATEMPPHNLGEVIDAIIYKINNPHAHLNKLMELIKGPDFPTGGVIQGTDGIYSAFERGAGKIVIKSKYTVASTKTRPSITISEIPFGVNKQKLVKDIDEIRFNKKISGIKEVRDESDRKGISIHIELTNGTNPENVVKYLLQKTEMQIYYNYNNISIVDHGPHQLGLISLINAYLKHQKEIQRKAINYDLQKDILRLEIVDGLIKVSTIADKVINTIRRAEGSRQGVIKSLMSEYKFTSNQANAIADLRLYRLSRTDQTVYHDEKVILEGRIARFNKILGSEEELSNYLIDLLTKLKADFATPRKSEIKGEIEKVDLNMEDLIKHEEVWVGVSRQGYIKRVSNRVFEANKLEAYALKDHDTVVYLNKVNTSDKLLVFTDYGRFIFIPIHTIQEIKWHSIGKHINDFATVHVDENIVDVIAVADFNLNIALTMATSEGRVKRTMIKDFNVSRWSRAMTAFKIKPEEKLVAVRPSNGFMNIILITSQGKAVKYSETDIPIYGPRSNGVKGISLPKGIKTTTMVTALKHDVIGIISKRGGAKRIKLSSIEPASKTTQGKPIYLAIKGNPHVALDARVVDAASIITFRDKKEHLIISNFKDVNITTPSEGFSLLGPSQTIDGRIPVFHKIGVDSKLLQEIADPEDHEENFKSATDKVLQISIDDILNKIK